MSHRYWHKKGVDSEDDAIRVDDLGEQLNIHDSVRRFVVIWDDEVWAKNAHEAGHILHDIYSGAGDEPNEIMFVKNGELVPIGVSTPWPINKGQENPHRYAMSAIYTADEDRNIVGYITYKDM